MDTNFYFAIVILLMGIAVLDLVVGVSNDAVNFLNSSIGSKVATRNTILLVASLGLLAGVFFSSGMMEVARKGIFHPQFFTMPELLTLFMAVMIADLLLLDLFNTYGMPTSTTVSIVFELLGAAVALSVIKILSQGQDLSALGEYINSAKALTIISGILLSVVVAFAFGALAQFFGRLLFSFHYSRYLGLFGGFWGGLCFASIALFILLKGAKGATFITPEMSTYIKTNLFYLFGATFLISGAFFQALVSIFRVNILKPIVLIGTFSLALAFAANDLVNFIGVPIASLHAYNAAEATSDPLGVNMGMLSGKVPSTTWLLLLSGAVMVLALWLSKKARSVTDTEVSLSSHDEENERFESLALSRVIVRLFTKLFAIPLYVTPRPIRKFVRRRFARQQCEAHSNGETPAFDLLRASTNLMMASVLVSFATSLKLPLSTTYVTFMVAMGTSFADQAWGKETAVYRVTGVLTVIGGWFMTALAAFTGAALFCFIIYYGQIPGIFALLLLAAYALWKTHGHHRDRAEEKKEEDVFNLRKISDASSARKETFKQTALFIGYLRSHLDAGLTALYDEDRTELRRHYLKRKKIQRWSNIIAANVFKVMRLLHRREIRQQGEYPQTVSCLQSLYEAYRDTLTRSYQHVRESHKGLLSAQKQELAKVHSELNCLLSDIEKHISGEQQLREEHSLKARVRIAQMLDEYSKLQNDRIHNGSSKTRLSLLYFAIMENMSRMSEHAARLYSISEKSLTNGPQREYAANENGK